jgi:flagellar biosynthesis GTPase FlhF
MPQQAQKEHPAQKEAFDWTQAIPWVVAAIAAIFGPVAGFFWAVYVRRRQERDTRQIETAKKSAGAEFDRVNKQQESLTLEERYRKMLVEKLGWVQMLGSPDIPNLPVHLLDTFVSRRISETWRSESRFDPEAQARQHESGLDFTPEQITQRVFSDRRMLVIIGDPGSGKTTLLKYYAMCCLSPEGWRKLGFCRSAAPAILSAGSNPLSL